MLSLASLTEGPSRVVQDMDDQSLTSQSLFHSTLQLKTALKK